MRFRKEMIPIALLFFSLTLGVGPWLGATQAMDCSTAAFQALNLTDEQFHQPVTNLTATMVPPAPPLPGYCLVQGTMWPEIGFAVELPTTWNNRFYMPGTGGTAGSIPYSAMVAGLQQGFATAGNNAGHDAVKDPSWSFAYPSPTNPNWEQKLIDHAYRANHETAVLGKKIVKSYYGSDPLYSYWVGCSGGGKQGLTEAQRFPEDFDGLVIGAPSLDSARIYTFNVWEAQALLEDGAIAVGKLPILADAIYKKCDSIDGLVDGVIDDPRTCTFDPRKDLPACPGDVDGPACFTTHQVEALEKIYGGARNSVGQLLFSGQAVGAEIAPPGGRSGWDGNILGNPSSNFRLVDGFLKYAAFYPNAPGPTYDFRTFNFDTDPQRMAPVIALINADNPDLSGLKQRGGKIIHYHGWADPMLPPLMSIDYYEDVQELFGEKETNDFYRFYLVPGMFHCGGGVGCSTFDVFTPLMDWVEEEIPPGKLIGSRVYGGNTNRTRPMCPYPQVARYLGSGSIDDASNFACAKIIPTEIRIEPETLKLDSKGTFTAFITLPWDYHVRDWEIRSVVCEGATAVKVAKKGHFYAAKFNRQDLINITAGEEVTFTVTVVLENRRHHDHHCHHEDYGHQIAFEGSDTVRVIEK